MEFSYVVIFNLIMFDCELWTNPQWSFGCSLTLFVWMGRRRGRL